VTIHKTAILNGNIKIGKNVSIGAYSILDGNIEIGDDTSIGNHVGIYNDVVIGKKNKIYNMVSIGTLGEMTFKGDVKPVGGLIEIGDQNTIREFVTIHFPSVSKRTKIGSKCYITSKSHIPHDAVLGDHVIMAHAIIGGSCIVEDHAFIGLNSVTHQGLTIGESAMVGMGSVNTKHVLPFSVVVGNPSKYLRFNFLSAERRGFTSFEINYIKDFNPQIRYNYHKHNRPLESIKAFIEKYKIENCIIQDFI